jgi:hypothetical protein
MARSLSAEWTKLRSVPSTFWLLMAAVGSTIAFGLLVCSAVDTAGSPPGCVPGRPGCGDEDVVMNSLSGAYLGQIPLVALGVLLATSEYATNTIRSTFAAMPWRSGVVLAKIAVLAGSAVVAGIVASALSFLLGQPILHGNGFVPGQGYPAVSIADPMATRAILGTGMYLGGVTVLGFAVGQITSSCRLRHRRRPRRPLRAGHRVAHAGRADPRIGAAALTDDGRTRRPANS